jgi:hypothetical protein
MISWGRVLKSEDQKGVGAFQAAVAKARLQLPGRSFVQIANNSRLDMVFVLCSPIANLLPFVIVIRIEQLALYRGVSTSYSNSDIS